jgi:uncharacterized protein (DUF362 family)
MESVAIVDVQQDIATPLAKGLELIGGFGPLASPVIIKPNICTISDNTGYSVTHALLIEGLIKHIFQANSKLSVYIVESDSQSKWANEAFTKFGYTDLAIRFQNEDFDVKLVNLSDRPTDPIPFSGDYFEHPELPDLLMKAGYIISVAQAKTHYLTSITGILKNLFGFLPKKKKGVYHPNINEVLVDLNRLFPVNLAVLDARVGVKGWNGPKTVPLGKLVLGHKPVSVDAQLAELMGINPQDIQHLIQCHKYGLGTLTPDIISD